MTLDHISTPQTSRSMYKVFSSAQSNLENSQLGSNNDFLQHLDKRFTKLRNYATRLQSPSVSPTKAEVLESLIKLRKNRERSKGHQSRNSNYVDTGKNLPLLDLKRANSHTPGHRNTRSRLELARE